MSQNLNIKYLVEAAIFAALAMVLSFIPDFFSWFSPSFGAIPLILFALRRGLKYGLLSGLIWGLLHFVLGKVYYLSMSQVFIEYLLAFASMGLAGLFSGRLHQALTDQHTTKATNIALFGAFIATATRYLWHFLAGILFWGSYAPKGVSPVWYSFTVNGTAGAFTLILVAIAILILIRTQRQFFAPQD
ncbi:energy-coupled thiamine transporter ThiT [Streptococcus pseudoporcinus]|uniref:Proton-coupled thiamine transporter YuaJ n=1 Tax=Streptococcus pseudoporcinus LQ 940-04 TaxID=875093 RepID=G5KBF3_9STRE|nr:energy-coupled thiamine transporter ThiT [Streptococcus pseudoporcinus]EFR44742.1 putative proton-coupled thiamine transporter YuaJ [Streptococcus pseudoporcinus SPIN 20026]EHI64395.1 putative proton-coupled thiamine transporter YuaJ [Streptococcus pseudoporcinus LQ 940-04]VEF94526.1 putative proton-coupled thiamine transporter YuaJ [Streptococcus pseudoporcinus]